MVPNFECLQLSIRTKATGSNQVEEKQLVVGLKQYMQFVVLSSCFKTIYAVCCPVKNNSFVYSFETYPMTPTAISPA